MKEERLSLVLRESLIRLIRKSVSLVFICWVILLICRIKYGESWNELLLLATAAVLFNRVSNQYIERKFTTRDEGGALNENTKSSEQTRGESDALQDN